MRSNGTVTYVGKDIAYQFWKFGLLGLDFHYRPFATSSDGAHALGDDQRSGGYARSAPAVRAARTRTYNVIDVRQSYLQKLLKQALAAMGHQAEAERSIHFCTRWWRCRIRRRASSATSRRTRTRRSRSSKCRDARDSGVKADDLIDRLERTAAAEVAKRNPELRRRRRRDASDDRSPSRRSATS